MTGVIETKELAVGLVKLGKEIAKLAKDGVTLADAGTLAIDLATNADLRNALIDAVKGCDKVLAEVKELSVDEVLEIGTAVVEAIKA